MVHFICGEMTVANIRARLRLFAEERDWNQFHTPKNLVMALSGEVGELNELFQWLTTEESLAIKESPEKRQQIREELADIFLYLINLSDKMDIDLLEAASEKIDLNETKYPVEKSRGSAKKYNEL